LKVSGPVSAFAINDSLMTLLVGWALTVTLLEPDERLYLMLSEFPSGT